MLKLERIYAGHRYKTIIGNINTELNPGKKLIVSGAPKSGKTTLLQTAAGIIPPVSGCVFFDFLPITEYSRKELGRRLCYIPQDILPADKTERILKALKCGFEYILADEPFAFLSNEQRTELLAIMCSNNRCGLIITENSAQPIQTDGFENLHLSPGLTLRKTAPSEENAVYM